METYLASFASNSSLLMLTDSISVRPLYSKVPASKPFHQSQFDVEYQ